MKKFLILLGVVIMGYCIYNCGDHKITNNRITAKMHPPTDEKAAQKPQHASIYIDASGSMKPYFSPGVEIIKTVSKLKTLDNDNTDIFFIGDKKARNGLVMEIIGTIKKQPNNVTTTFHEFFKEQAAVLDTTDAISYLVTDGIMSVGKNIGHTKKALVELQGKITAALMPYSSTMAAAIFQYSGMFNGKYCHQNDSTSKYNGLRPYYVIAIGQKPYIKWLASQKAEKLNNPEGELFMGLHSPAGHAQTEVFDTVHPIDPFKDVTLSVELPECLKGRTLPADPYVMNNGNRLSTPVTNDGTTLKAVIPNGTPGFSADGAGQYTAKIVVPNSIPSQWESWSVEDDLGGADSITTFGLIYLVRGINAALEPNDTLMVATFNFKQ